MAKNKKNSKENINVFSLMWDVLPPLAAGPLVLFFVFLNVGEALSLTARMTILALYVAAAVGYAFAVNKIKRRLIVKSEETDIAKAAFSGNLEKLPIPVLLLTSSGVIKWSNHAATKMVGKGDLYDKFFGDLTDNTVASVISGNSSSSITLNGHKYRTSHFAFTHQKEDHYIFLFDDITELDNLEERYENDKICVALILIDNLAEIASETGNGEYRDAANIIDKCLKEWAVSIDAVIKELANDRYIMFFRQAHIASLVEGKFEIIDRVVSAQEGEVEIPLTVSMGVSAYGESIVEREKIAAVALDNAMQRGGAQAALKNDDKGYSFFGGRVKTSYKRTSVRSRMEAVRLISLVEKADNVIIMGHANPDYDAIGGCLGLAKLAETYGKNVMIVTNKHCDNFRICTDRLFSADSTGYYSNLFADSERGLDAISSGTLVILADVNSIDRCESPVIAQRCAKLAIIDHHRRSATRASEVPDLNYIDPSASSTCEIVSEMLDFSPRGVGISADEASVMMSGIMLDTQNFVKSVGTRTFSAALYLRNMGASNEIANSFFYEEIDDYNIQKKLMHNMRMFRGKYIIASSILEDGINPRIAVSKAANKMLSFKDAEAAFAIAAQGNMVYISGRSNGKINVQIILEAIGGGGHYEAAAASFDGKELVHVLGALQDSINNYEDK